VHENRANEKKRKEEKEKYKYYIYYHTYNQSGMLGMCQEGENVRGLAETPLFCTYLHWGLPDI